MKPKIDPFRAILVIAGGVIAISLALKCSAGEAELTWVAPTQNCNGTSLTNLTGYSLTYGQSRVALGATPLNYTVRGLTPGTWWFSLAAVTPTDRSEFVTVEKVVAPEEFVTVGGPVFNIVKRVDRFLLVSVGTIPPGVQCVAGHSVNGNYVVPRASVVWAGSVRPDAVVAQCQ